MNKLHAHDTESWLDTIWSALHAYREDCIPEGNEDYDDEWSDICTAMAWIEEQLSEPDTDDYISYDFREGQIVELFHERPQAAWDIDSAPDTVLRRVIAWAEKQKEFDDYERVNGDMSAMEQVRSHIRADKLNKYLSE